jgi:hypothetical protein
VNVTKPKLAKGRLGANNIKVTRGRRPRKSENLHKNEWAGETITKARI